MALVELAKELGRALRQQGVMMTVAESCTGGWIGEVVTAEPGSSRWFDRGFVTYSNIAKREMLGVKAATLARSGAVSEPTARAMAEEYFDAEKVLRGLIDQVNVGHEDHR